MPRRRQTTERTLQELRFGHFGPARYDLKERKWIFSRQIVDEKVLRLVTAPREVYAGSSQGLGAAENPYHHLKHSTYSRHRAHYWDEVVHAEDRTSSLTSAFSELQAARDCITNPEQESQVVVQLTRSYDPTSGELIALGKVKAAVSPNGVSSSETCDRVLAFACGDSGQNLRVAYLGRCMAKWNKHDNVGLDMLDFNGPSCIWAGHGAPIQQVASSLLPEDTIFASENIRCSFFAVRLPWRTEVLWPAISCGKQGMEGIRIISIASILPEDNPHVEVSFNTWKSNELGIIDSKGSWWIWQLRWKGNTMFKVKERLSGLFPGGDKISLFDRWCKLVWVRDARTFLFCTRQCLFLVDIAGQPTIIKPWNFKLKDTPHWILDVKTPSSWPNDFFVLTSLHIFHVRIPSHQEDLNQASSNILLSWQHFRDLEDFTMSMSLFEEPDSTVILIHSQINSSVTQVRFFSRPNEISGPSTSEPALIQYRISTPLLGLVARYAKYTQSSDGLSSSLGQDYKDKNVCFQQHFALDQGFALHECLSVSCAPEHLCLPKLSKPKAKLPEKQHRDDWMMARGFTTDMKSLKPTVKVKVGKQKPNHRTWDIVGAFQEIYKLLFRSESHETFGNMMQRLRNQLEGTDVGSDSDQLIGTIFDLTDDVHFEVKDPFAASAVLQEFLDEFLATSLHSTIRGAELIRAIFPNWLCLPMGHSHPTNLSSTYELVVDGWETPLPEGISSTIRRENNKTARRIAADLVLSSYLLQAKGMDDEELAIKSERSDSRPPSQSSQRRQEPLQDETLSQSLSQATASNSFSEEAGGSSSSSAPNNSATIAFKRLSKHITFSKPPPTTYSLQLDHVHRHWPTLGENPKSYDWVKVVGIIEAEEEEEVAMKLMDTDERKRYTQKKKKTQAQQRLEDEKLRLAQSQSQSNMSLAQSQIPIVGGSTRPVTRSQTQTRPMAVQSQQPFASTQGMMGTGMGDSQSQTQQSQPMMPASQVLPGPYGGRPPPKKKQKKKAGGFG
ncbi:hypothetical protein K402DRAFT_464697 [Aulographum hederae CBS 113979]|uniref:RNA polymerase I-specific transcription initiation factor RRN6-like protein n=1 Tax=Aulographum hederae CBS 113979 TaxID=1176131 RepID=A0A6G1GW65_9PEZI|nr:hypothetical protein K402DRAFT_464697 [Aulographum hederae CBS 113979]